MGISIWKVPFDNRYNGDFKIRDYVSVEIFMKDALKEGNCYAFKDVNDETMYYSVEKSKEGQAIFAHTKYGDGILPPVVWEYDDIIKKIYKARKSFNQYFFTEE